MTQWSYVVFSSLIFLHAFANAAVNSLPPLVWKPSAIGFSLNSEYLMSNAVYEDARGSFHRLANGNSLTSFENTFRGMYGLSKSWYAYGGIGFNIERVLETSVEKTNTNLSEAQLGSYFLLWQKYLRVIGEFTAGFPLEAAKQGQTPPLLSDGATYFTGRVHLFKPMFRINFLGQLGFHFPLEGLSKKLLYDLALEKPFGTNFSAGAGLGGYETVMNDDQTFAQRTAIHATSMGGSNRFQAYNPALLEGRLWFGFSPERTYRIRVGYAKSLNGVRSAESQSVFVQMNFNLSWGVTETDMSRYPDERADDRYLDRIDALERTAEQDLREEERLKKNLQNTNPDEMHRPRRPPSPPPRPRGPDPLDETEKLMNDTAPKE